VQTRQAVMRVLIVGGGIGGLAAAVALQRVGIAAAVFERAPVLTAVGAGLSLWSNAMLALRRLRLEAPALAAGSPIERTRTFLPGGELLGGEDFAAFGAEAGASSICLRRAALQRLLLKAALARDPRSVATGRECGGFVAGPNGVAALFRDGSRENGDILVGADGIHSIVRAQLFGPEKLRPAGCLAWRGIADGPGDLPEHEAMVVLAPGAGGVLSLRQRTALLVFDAERRTGLAVRPIRQPRRDLGMHQGLARAPFHSYVEATPEDAILRDDIADRRRDGFGASAGSPCSATLLTP
jgi:2-polyprenyl-6-methoxyphenol hydroxylase-like FAD-dependent oxidoreductase